MATVTTFDNYVRLSDARFEGAFEGRVARLLALGDHLGWTYRRTIEENDLDKSGRVKLRPQHSKRSWCSYQMVVSSTAISGQGSLS